MWLFYMVLTRCVCGSAGELQEDGEAGWRRPQALQRADHLLPGACQDREGLFAAAEWLGQEMEGCCGERWSGLWDLVWGHRGSACSAKIACYRSVSLVDDQIELPGMQMHHSCLLNMAKFFFYSVRNFINMIMWHSWLCLACAVQ